MRAEQATRRAQVSCDVGAPQVNYRESISRVADVKYVHRKQSGGSGQFADVSIRFEPGEPGTGFEFRSEIKGGAIPKEYIPGVVKGLEEMMSSGSLAGFPVVDVVAVLHDGSYHDVDSSVLAFQIAARAAFREGMRKGAARLLEPIMQARSSRAAAVWVALVATCVLQLAAARRLCGFGDMQAGLAAGCLLLDVCKGNQFSLCYHINKGYSLPTHWQSVVDRT